MPHLYKNNIFTKINTRIYYIKSHISSDNKLLHSYKTGEGIEMFYEFITALNEKLFDFEKFEDKEKILTKICNILKNQEKKSDKYKPEHDLEKLQYELIFFGKNYKKCLDFFTKLKFAMSKDCKLLLPDKITDTHSNKETKNNDSSKDTCVRHEKEETRQHDSKEIWNDDSRKTSMNENPLYYDECEINKNTKPKSNTTITIDEGDIIQSQEIQQWVAIFEDTIEEVLHSNSMTNSWDLIKQNDITAEYFFYYCLQTDVLNLIGLASDENYKWQVSDFCTLKKGTEVSYVSSLVIKLRLKNEILDEEVFVDQQEIKISDVKRDYSDYEYFISLDKKELHVILNSHKYNIRLMKELKVSVKTSRGTKCVTTHV